MDEVIVSKKNYYYSFFRIIYIHIYTYVGMYIYPKKISMHTSSLTRRISTLAYFSRS